MDRPTQFGHLVALDICNELLTLCQEARDRQREATERNSTSHADFQRQYHIMEVLPNFNAFEGWRMARAFHHTLRARRQAKWDIDAYAFLVPVVNNLERQLSNVQSRLGKSEVRHVEYIAGKFTDGEEAAD